jgi:acyl-CoA thioesterase-1
MSINRPMSIKPIARCLAIILLLLVPVTLYADQPRVLVLGDSLVAGYGLPPGQSLPDQLQRDLAAKGMSVSVINAGVSGDTTAGGLARLDWSLADNPDAVIIVLGGNDMLRGLPPEGTAANLGAIISRLRERQIEVLLAGMMAPRNLGPAYVEAFDAIYPALARRHDIEFYPFFLDGVALDPALNLDDGLHPNMQGISEISRRMLPVRGTSSGASLAW